MALLGWLVLVLVALALTAATAVAGTLELTVRGEVDGEVTLCAALAVVLWALAYKYAPFTLVMSGGAP